MLTVERTEVYGWEPAIRGARNPMNSWAKSDSKWMHRCTLPDGNGFCENCTYDACRSGFVGGEEFIVGPNDLDLMKRLANAGPDHRKFMRMLTVTTDVTAPLYWWKEYDTYKIGTTANSCSTMHKIHAKEIELSDFSTDHMSKKSSVVFAGFVKYLESVRKDYLKSKDKADWYDMIQLLPSSYNQMRTIHLNYETLRNMYHARKTHKLAEWHTLCDWIATLPYAQELIIGEVTE